MDHHEAIQQMAAERYLLNELPPDAREAFEEHLFDCSECALDIRAGSAFVDEAKIQLPELAQPLHSPLRPAFNQPTTEKRTAKGQIKSEQNWWLAWWRPIYVAPAFAALLLVLGYQNSVTLPALRAAATEPRIVPLASLHGATRGGTPVVAVADQKTGVALPIEFTLQPGMDNVTSFSFNLRDQQQKLIWTGTATSAAAESGDKRFLLEIPGVSLRKGSYSVDVTAIGPHGERTLIEDYAFKIQFASETAST